MRYIVWHTPRTGSNLLMNLLHHTGAVGIKSYVDCGFFVGYKQPSEKAWKTALRQYFVKQRTDKWETCGVEGAKVGIDYFTDLKIEGMTQSKLLTSFMGSVDIHFVLQRLDIIAQAVSLYFAVQQNYYSTWGNSSKKASKPPEYNAQEILWHLGRIKSDQQRLLTIFQYNRTEFIPLSYEKLIENPQMYITGLMAGMGIKAEDWTYKNPTIQKQEHPLKQEYIARFREEMYDR